MPWCMYLQSFDAFSSYSAKTKCDGQTDGQTARLMGGGGVLQYLPSWAFGAAGDKNAYTIRMADFVKSASDPLTLNWVQFSKRQGIQ